MSEINVVPYIDVMLVLLVIFMITAPMLSQGVKVDLPQASSKPLTNTEKQNEPLIVTVDKKGRYFLNIGNEPKKPIVSKELVNRVKAILSIEIQTPVYIKGDQAANYGMVVEAMSLLQQAGAPTVGLVTDPKLPDKGRR